MQRLKVLAFVASLIWVGTGLAACGDDDDGADRATADGGAEDGGQHEGRAGSGGGSGGKSGTGGSAGRSGAGGSSGSGGASGSSGAGGSGDGSCSSNVDCTSPEVCDLAAGQCGALAVLSIEVTPTNPTIALQTAVQLTATATHNDGTTEDVSAQVTWTSSDTGVATVDGGLATAVAVGEATISAALDDVTGSTLLNVSDATLQSLTVTPTNPTIATGTTQAFTATGNFSDGTTQDLTGQSSWASSATDVATIDAAGVASGIAAGSSTITASVLGVDGTTTLTVTSAQVTSILVQPTNATIATGTSQQFTAQALFDDGTSQDVSMQVTWASSDETVATISNAAGTAGLASSVGEGDTSITATLDGISGTSSLTVTAATLVSITVDPALPTVAAGLSQQFTAVGTFSDATTQDLTTQVLWASSDTAVATVSNAQGSQGLAQTIAAGSTTISASLGSVSGATMLAVTSAAVASITVDPIDPTIANGIQQQFTATGIFTDGTSQDVTAQAVWASSDPAVAVISNAVGSEGLAQSVSAGSTTISATLNGVSGTSLLTVSATTLASIAIDPVNASIAQGTSQQLTATGTFSDGSTADLTTQVTWSSSKLTVATVSNASGSEGLATSTGMGSTTISAALAGVTGQTQLTVTAAQLVSISVTPADPSLKVSTQLQFTAIGTFDNGSSQDITSQVNWLSSDMAVATISNAAITKGVATGLSPGQSTISANFQGMMGQTTLTVAAVALQSITITPADSTIGTGTKQQFTATGNFADGSMQDLTNQVTWSSSAQNIAMITNVPGARGSANGLSAGTTTISAALNGVTGTTMLTVAAVTLTSIAVTPATTTIARGDQQQYTAIGTFSDGSMQDLTGQVIWTSSHPNVAGISNAPSSHGLATAVTAGTTTIRAMRGAVEGTAELTVTQ